ncbi:hypothetical protein LOZ39_005357 [Ophidiomyces ophidiicola]|nr:hypothetical protein LOZ50_003536 [Ophidiomyces ophidiicola]KAI2007381.1 hypothetical protein LOZ49_004665 [Ophidiomyces ophidiicola]KAI2024986.1 hypothetical protein LOZ46_000739 [Ophidiomyces ophidiicola]KAI2069511.1 hypothetical protein LOZ39_005357 [Ophidiomyces ophidiicola]KAI2131006.1 hypothetical protein LOZ29_005585 [Ophidiomyces ophidiicola]
MATAMILRVESLYALSITSAVLHFLTAGVRVFDGLRSRRRPSGDGIFAVAAAWFGIGFSIIFAILSHRYIDNPSDPELESLDVSVLIVNPYNAASPNYSCDFLIYSIPFNTESFWLFDAGFAAVCNFALCCLPIQRVLTIELEKPARVWLFAGATVVIFVVTSSVLRVVTLSWARGASDPAEKFLAYWFWTLFENTAMVFCCSMASFSDRVSELFHWLSKYVKSKIAGEGLQGNSSGYRLFPSLWASQDENRRDPSFQSVVTPYPSALDSTYAPELIDVFEPDTPPNGESTTSASTSNARPAVHDPDDDVLLLAAGCRAFKTSRNRLRQEATERLREHAPPGAP